MRIDLAVARSKILLEDAMVTVNGLQRRFRSWTWSFASRLSVSMIL